MVNGTATEKPDKGIGVKCGMGGGAGCCHQADVTGGVMYPLCVWVDPPFGSSSRQQQAAIPIQEEADKLLQQGAGQLSQQADYLIDCWPLISLPSLAVVICPRLRSLCGIVVYSISQNHTESVPLLLCCFWACCYTFYSQHQ